MTVREALREVRTWCPLVIDVDVAIHEEAVRLAELYRFASMTPASPRPRCVPGATGCSARTFTTVSWSTGG